MKIISKTPLTKAEKEAIIYCFENNILSFGKIEILKVDIIQEIEEVNKTYKEQLLYLINPEPFLKMLANIGWLSLHKKEPIYKLQTKYFYIK